MIDRFINLIHISTLFLIVSCTGKSPVQDITNSDIRYASLLQMQSLDDGIVLCRIANPWKDHATVKQYLLVPKDHPTFDADQKTSLAEKFGDSEVIRTPLTRTTLTASCHGYLLAQIDATANIAVYCDAEYVEYQDIRERIDSGLIQNGGSSMAPNIETILSQRSDAIWISPFENASTASVEALPLPVIYCADYMETSPLGRAEWMRFYGRLVGKGTEADSLFHVVETNYTSLKAAAITADSGESASAKTIFSELPYQATWYVPGGRSTMGILYHDAGYKYVWADDPHSGSLALSAEIVLDKAGAADYWLIKYLSDHDYTLDELLSHDNYYRQFKAARMGNVFGCNTQHSDFYDVTPFRPDSLLWELQNIGDGSYFKRLQ